MEVGVMSAQGEYQLYLGFGFLIAALVIAGIFFVGSFGKKDSDKDKKLICRTGLIVALLFVIPGAIFVGLGSVKFEAGNCLSSLPNRDFAVEAAFPYMDNSVYVVAAGTVSSETKVLARRCVVIKGDDKEVVGFPGTLYYIGPGQYMLEVKKHSTSSVEDHSGETKQVERTWQTYTFVPVPPK